MDFVCLDCGLVFDDPVRYTETHGLEYGPYEHYYGCPKCRGAFTQAYKCDCCGEWIEGDYIRVGDNIRYCDNCCTQMELGDED